MLVLLALLAVNEVPTPTPAPTAPSTVRQKLDDAWWTGPMLAAGASTLPRGHVLVEPYVYDVVKYAHYDTNGTAQPAKRVNNYGSLTYVLYGLTDTFTVGVIPTAGITAPQGGPNTSGIGMGDLSLLAQYRLVKYRPESWMPITSLVVQETLPTGRYDRLGSNPSNGLGSGVYTTMVSLHTQKYFWMPNGRILRTRLNLSKSFSSSADVNGVSVYGTPSTFHGTAKPGDVFTVDLAGEYSVTRRWVLALDAVTEHDARTRVSDSTGVTQFGDSHTFYLAPAVEYNWSPNYGVLFGVRLTPAGRNTSATFAPVAAVNMFW